MRKNVEKHVNKLKINDSWQRKSRNRQGRSDKKVDIPAELINNLICCNLSIYAVYFPALELYFTY